MARRREAPAPRGQDGLILPLNLVDPSTTGVNSSHTYVEFLGDRRQWFIDHGISWNDRARQDEILRASLDHHGIPAAPQPVTTREV